MQYLSEMDLLQHIQKMLIFISKTQKAGRGFAHLSKTIA